MEETDVFDSDEMVKISLKRVPHWHKSKMPVTSPEASAEPEGKGLKRSGLKGLTSPMSMPNLANMFQQELMKEQEQNQDEALNANMRRKGSVDSAITTPKPVPERKTSVPTSSYSSDIMKWLTTSKVPPSAAKMEVKTESDVQENVQKMRTLVRNFSASDLQSYGPLDSNVKKSGNREINTWAPSVW